MTAANLDAILGRIKKLQAMQESPNVNEAAVAAAKLQELLQKHNLDLSKIDTGEESAYDAESFTVSGSKSDLGWKRSLMNSIARTNFCRTVYTSGTAYISIIGEEHNILVVKAMYDFLEGEIRRLSNLGWREEGKFVASNPKAWKRAFSNGAVSTIYTRLAAQLADARQDEGMNALVIDKQAELDQAFSKLFPYTKTRRARRISDASAYWAGSKAAENIPLNRPVDTGNGSGPKALKG